jgi:hypothetical protein
MPAKTTQTPLTAEENKEWEDLKGQLQEVTMVFGAIMMMPVILLVGLGWGFRAGIIAGAEKTLEMLKSWR